MRADRLIAALLLLQQRDKITAAELAQELEVSERTARRDLEALAMSGVPVYSTHGRGGGWRLIGGATTDLTGLSSSESRALFVALSRAGAGEPTSGADGELAAALRKLTGALPEPFRGEANLATDAIRIDARGWGQLEAAASPPFLDELTDAVLSERRVKLDYVNASGERAMRDVDPLGLVTKRGVWYLVANTPRGVRTYRIDRVKAVNKLDGAVQRPDGFDLDETWREIVTVVESQRIGLEVRCRVHPDAMRAVRWQFARRMREVATDDDGWHEVLIGEYGATPFAAQIVGHGKRVQLLDAPDDVIAEVRRITHELAEMYGS